MTQVWCADKWGPGMLVPKNWAVVCSKLSWRTNYWAKTSPNTKSQSESWYCRGLVRRSLQIMWEYNLASVIAIRPLTHPHTSEMVSSGFSNISWLKLLSMTRASFRSIHTLRGKMEKVVSVAPGSAYCSYAFFSSTNKPGYYPLDNTCMYPRQHRQIWCWWWHQSGFPISLR